MFFTDDSNRAWLVSRLFKTLVLLCCFAGGTLYAAALPPLNWSWGAWIFLLPLFWAGTVYSWKFSWLCGWCWGLGWAFFSCRFLREIEFFVPYLLAPVLALWPALWACLLPGLKKWCLFPARAVLWKNSERRDFLKNGLSNWRVLYYSFATALLFTLICWSRSRLFVWNDLSVTQWRNLPVIQLSALTGSYGIVFLIVLVNAGLFALLNFRKRGLASFAAALLALTAAVTYGSWRLGKLDRLPPPEKTVSAGLIQCDLSQRRHASEAEALEAVEVCTALSRQAAGSRPDLLIWPESAVPVPLWSASLAGNVFRREFARLLQEIKLPVLAGMLAFKSGLNQELKVTNSALFFTPEGRMTARYDKIHRVPYGEYVPFRRFLPEWLIRSVDMGRDLEPGSNFEPMEIAPGIRASVAVCYEGVFGYLMRDFARRGAQLFIVLSNDAWYPQSSEPEQHLANAVIRAVENGLPMIRCGNNGGSGVVTPAGRFTQYIGSAAPRPELLRERAAGTVTVPLYSPEKSMTLYRAYGEWFILLLAVAAVVILNCIVIKEIKSRTLVKQLISGEKNDESTNNRHN